MDRKFLEGLGFEKEVVDKILDVHSADIGKHKTQITELAGERDSLKGQLDDVAKKLSAFESVDIDGLRGQIDALKGDMAAKEADFKAQLFDRDFQSAINAEIAAAKGKNPKAVMALLDVDTLKASKNQKEDIASALKSLRETDAYLFEDGKKAAEPSAPRAKLSTGGAHSEGGTQNTNANAMMNNILRGATSEGE